MADTMKARAQRILSRAALAALAVAGPGLAQTGNYMPTNIANTASAVQAYQVQGEYVGVTSAGDTLGAWVVARGSNSYFLSLLPGGLVRFPADTSRVGSWNGVNKYTGTATWNSSTNAYAVTTAAGYATTSITGEGVNRVLNGTFTGGVTFALRRVVRKSPTQGLKPKPSWSAGNLGTALSWFDSSAAATNPSAELAKWANNGANPARQYGGYLYRGVRTTATHGAGYLHIECMSAFYPSATGQNRGNSGIYLHSKYEAQVLDSFGLNGAANELGGIYNVAAPRTNAALPPMVFQTYDIYFTPRTSGANGEAAGAAVMTVYLNGVLVQDSVPVPVTTEAGATGSQLTASYLALQNHSNEVVFNNIWFIPFSGTDHKALRQALPFDSVLVHANPTVGLKHGPRASRHEAEGISGPVFDAAGRLLRREGALPTAAFSMPETR